MLPKIIWLYWEQGWRKAPTVVKKCRESWLYHNPGWEIRCLDRKSLKDYFDIDAWMPGQGLKGLQGVSKQVKDKVHSWLHTTQRIKYKTLKLPAKSDIIRINLLARYGGVWADATLWCHHPLESWMHPYFGQGFFALAKPWEWAQVSSYFLIAEQGHYIVSKWSEAVTKYWSEHDEADHYFWFYHLFNELYEKDKQFSVIWDQVKKIEDPVDANYGPHFFAPYKKEVEGFAQEYKDFIDTTDTPVFKLTHRRRNPLEDYPKIQYLFNTIKPK